MSVRLVYNDIAVGADSDAAMSTDDAQPGSQVSQLTAGTDFVPMITLEPNQWKFNGKHKTMAGKTFGLLSNQMSGADGTFSTPPALEIDFDKQYTSLGITIRFDPSIGAYCNNLTIKWYQGTTLLSEKTFSPDGVEYFCENTVTAYNKVEITFNSTALPGRYLRLTKIMFGISRIFGLGELRNVKVTEEINLISAEVSINTMDFTLDSADNVDFIFQRKQPIFAYDSDTLIGVFYVSDSSRAGAGLYDVSCADAIGVLDEETIPSVMLNATPIQTALENVVSGYFDLEIAPELLTETLTGLQPEGTRRNALQQIAFGARAIVDTSGTDKIKIYRAQTGTAKVMGQDKIYSGSTTKTDSIVTAIKLTAHTYSTSGSGETIVVGGVTYHHTTQVVTINNPDVTATDKQNVIEITNATLVNATNVNTVAQYVYDYYMRRSTQSVKIVLDGDNPGDLVQTETPWGTEFEGNITRMDITLSGTSAAVCSVIGSE